MSQENVSYEVVLTTDTSLYLIQESKHHLATNHPQCHILDSKKKSYTDTLSFNLKKQVQVYMSKMVKLK